MIGSITSMDKNKDIIPKLIDRVVKMENYFDIVQTEFQKYGLAIYENEDIQTIIQLLKSYYESGQWLQDYESDEQGMLPRELKRGVLSEDGLYNLLSEIER